MIHVSELSDNFVSDPMEVVKVGDIFEFTIIGLDKDRKRISLSLKSDAANRIGGASSGSAKSSSEKTGERRKVVVVKKGSKPDSGKTVHRNEKFGQRGGGRSYGSDDGMSYNPFVALLKK